MTHAKGAEVAKDDFLGGLGGLGVRQIRISEPFRRIATGSDSVQMVAFHEPFGFGVFHEEDSGDGVFLLPGSSSNTASRRRFVGRWRRTGRARSGRL